MRLDRRFRLSLRLESLTLVGSGVLAVPVRDLGQAFLGIRVAVSTP